MMKFLEILRISILEVLIGFLTYYFLVNNSEVVEFISSRIFIPTKELSDYLKLFGLPVAILAMNYKYGNEILNPSDKDNKKKLKDFPLYWRLKYRVWYSILVSLFMILGTILCWYYAITTNNQYFYTILIMVFLSISLTTFLSMAKARLEIKDILY